MKTFNDSVSRSQFSLHVVALTCDGQLTRFTLCAGFTHVRYRLSLVEPYPQVEILYLYNLCTIKIEKI